MRVAEEMDLVLGSEVGYITGYESLYDKDKSFLLFVTNGVFLQILRSVAAHQKFGTNCRTKRSLIIRVSSSMKSMSAKRTQIFVFGL